MHALIQSLDSVFGKKAPMLPESVREFIVKAAPYVAIIGLIFSVFSLFGLLALMLGSGVLTAYAAAYAISWTHIVISLIFGVIVGILELMAIPGLFKKTEKAWNLIFYAELVSLLSMIISLNIIGFIVSGVISFYILFQIRSHYLGGSVATGPTSASTPTPAPTSTPATPAA